MGTDTKMPPTEIAKNPTSGKTGFLLKKERDVVNPSSLLTQSLARKWNHGESPYHLANKRVLKALDREGSKPSSLYT